MSLMISFDSYDVELNDVLLRFFACNHALHRLSVGAIDACPLKWGKSIVQYKTIVV